MIEIIDDGHLVVDEYDSDKIIEIYQKSRAMSLLYNGYLIFSIRYSNSMFYLDGIYKDVSYFGQVWITEQHWNDLLFDVYKVFTRTDYVKDMRIDYDDENALLLLDKVLVYFLTRLQ